MREQTKHPILIGPSIPEIIADAYFDGFAMVMGLIISTVMCLLTGMGDKPLSMMFYQWLLTWWTISVIGWFVFGTIGAIGCTIVELIFRWRNS